MACDNNSFLTAPEARIIARDSVTVFTEICAIQQDILDAIGHCPPPGQYRTVVPTAILSDPPQPVDSVGDGTIETTGRTVESAVTTTAGNGYPASSTVNAIFEAPTGTEATLGSAYTDGDGIQEVVILDGGTGYIGGEPVTIDDLGSGGTGATAEVASVSTVEGTILEIAITNAGTGYTTNGKGLIDPPPNTTAVGTVPTDSSGEIIAGQTVTITNPGSSYLEDPSFFVENPNGPFPPNITFLPVTPMTTTLDTDNDGRPDSWMYYETYVGQLDSPEISDQLTYVQKYFTDLGYNIQIEVNPVTMNTLQWQIRW